MSIALGIVLGIVLVVLFLGSTPMILEPLIKAAPSASPATALMFFGAKAVAGIIVLLLLFDVGGLSDHVHMKAFGITAAATAVAWSGLLVLRFRSSRTPTYDLGNGPQ